MIKLFFPSFLLFFCGFFLLSVLLAFKLFCFYFLLYRSLASCETSLRPMKTHLYLSYTHLMLQKTIMLMCDFRFMFIRFFEFILRIVINFQTNYFVVAFPSIIIFFFVCVFVSFFFSFLFFIHKMSYLSIRNA